MYNGEIECAFSGVFSNTVVTIDWQFTSYIIEESRGTLMACAEITSGRLEREVVVKCETADAQLSQQATGKNSTGYI